MQISGGERTLARGGFCLLPLYWAPRGNTRIVPAELHGTDVPELTKGYIS